MLAPGDGEAEPGVTVTNFPEPARLATDSSRRGLDRFRCNAAGLLSSFLHWTADERHLSGVRSMRSKAQLVGLKGCNRPVEIGSTAVAGAWREIRIESMLSLPSSYISRRFPNVASKMSRPDHR